MPKFSKPSTAPKPNSYEVFLDANIFIAAVKSPEGGSGLILMLAGEKRVKIVTVKHALREAEQNVRNKFGEKFLERYYQLLLNVTPRVQAITGVTLAHAATLLEVVPPKDIPILLGALLSNARFFVTLDKKHFLANTRLKELFPHLVVVNPASFLADFVSTDGKHE